MSTDDPHQLPGSVPLRLDDALDFAGDNVSDLDDIDLGVALFRDGNCVEVLAFEIGVFLKSFLKSVFLELLELFGDLIGFLRIGNRDLFGHLVNLTGLELIGDLLN